MKFVDFHLPKAAVDLGITNIDIVVVSTERHRKFFRVANHNGQVDDELQRALGLIGYPLTDFEMIAVTGGKYRSLPEKIASTTLTKVSEVDAIGRGGLQLAGKPEALVISAGSGMAAVAARPTGCRHVTGSAVGGGTLLGLGRLLLETTDPLEIDHLALHGDANAADLTLHETLGGAVGNLPSDANAVNFGKLARNDIDLSRPDLAAALVRMVGQVIAVIAINAARAEALDTIVITGHLADLQSIRDVFQTVAGYYGARIIVPESPGFGTVLGALIALPQS